MITRLLTLLLGLCLAAGAGAACERSVAGQLFGHGFEPCPPRTRSAQLVLERDFTVPAEGRTEVLAYEFWLDAPATVLAVADGRHFPQGEPNPTAELIIAIDGDSSASSRSVLDWTTSRFPVQHAFRVLASARLEAGAHRVVLQGSSREGERQGAFTVGAGSGLAVLVDPRSELTESQLVGTSSRINLTTYAPLLGIDTVEGGADRPWEEVLRQEIANPAAAPVSVVSLAAGFSEQDCWTPFNRGRGDVLWGLVADGVCPATDQAAWGVNDIDIGAEMIAPVAVQSAHALAPGESLQLDFVLSELAFGSDQEDAPAGAHENGVCHRAGDVRFLSLSGAGVAGGAPTEPAAFCSTYTWRCVATGDGVEGCPPVGSEVVLGRAEIDIPPGHDGQVLFSAQTRIQGTNENGFATAKLYLKVDGVYLGARGVQQLVSEAGQASRTLTASVLTAAPAAAPLAPGRHVVEAVIRGESEDLRYLSVPRDLALVWFD